MGGKSIHCPARILLVSLLLRAERESTASMGDPGSVKTATEYDHIQSAYNVKANTAKVHPG